MIGGSIFLSLIGKDIENCESFFPPHLNVMQEYQYTTAFRLIYVVCTVLQKKKYISGYTGPANIALKQCKILEKSDGDSAL
jgi:hypothetical protein